MPSTNKKNYAPELGANPKEPARKARGVRHFSESTDGHAERDVIETTPSRSRSGWGVAARQRSAYVPQRSSVPILLPERSSSIELHVVHLSLLKEGARNVCVAGTFNDWKPRRTPMRCNALGQWEVDLSLAPGDYEYRFVVDGEWWDDPLSRQHVPNPFGGMNAVLHVQHDETAGPGHNLVVRLPPFSTPDRGSAPFPSRGPGWSWARFIFPMVDRRKTETASPAPHWLS